MAIVFRSDPTPKQATIVNPVFCILSQCSHNLLNYNFTSRTVTGCQRLKTRKPKPDEAYILLIPYIFVVVFGCNMGATRCKRV